MSYSQKIACHILILIIPETGMKWITILNQVDICDQTFEDFEFAVEFLIMKNLIFQFDFNGEKAYKLTSIGKKFKKNDALFGEFMELESMKINN